MNYVKRFDVRKMITKYNRDYILIKSVEYDRIRKSFLYAIDMFKLIKASDGEVITDRNVYMQSITYNPLHRFSYGYESERLAVIAMNKVTNNDADVINWLKWVN